MRLFPPPSRLCFRPAEKKDGATIFSLDLEVRHTIFPYLCGDRTIDAVKAETQCGTLFYYVTELNNKNK